ncbi:MAG TPA: prephenate dehydrogenase/arogenate dehydrogenase family protein [Dehalococcoidia bacterium]|nr:prephenate dehydrogenase/arogenate dehydrogenase family protein [Dehalococcoidia bacterium]
MEKLSILGLGLIGGSVGLGLKAGKFENLEIWGFDREWGVGPRAQKAGAIDRYAGSAAAAVRDAAVVVIATPVLAARELFREIAPDLREGAVVIDTCSTKAQVVRWASELLPPHVEFVGGHPMAGKTESGLAAADAALFRDRPFVLTPGPDASERSIAIARALVEALGAKPVFMDPEEHDSYVAAVSHLPLLTSVALFTVAQQSQAWPELAQLAAGGFLDTTRLASGEPEMAHDIFLTNGGNVVHWLDRYVAMLTEFRKLIAEGQSEELFERLSRARLERERFLANPFGLRKEPAPEVPSTGETLASLLVGAAVVRRMKEVNRIFDEPGRPGERR